MTFRDLFSKKSTDTSSIALADTTEREPQIEINDTIDTQMVDTQNKRNKNFKKKSAKASFNPNTIDLNNLPTRNEVSLPKGWYVQVNAPEVRDEAKLIASSLQKNGYSVAIEPATVKGTKYFRVLVGPNQSSATAKVLQSKLKNEDFVEQDAFLKIVK